MLALLLLPALLWGFVHYASATNDDLFLSQMEQRMEASNESAQYKQSVMALLRANPPSTSCSAPVDGLPGYREEFCEPYSYNWQFFWAERVAVASVVAGIVLLLSVAGLGLAAFRSRAAQYRSLVVGWRLFAYASAAEVLVQCAMLVWLSFWLTAHFFEIYIMKLVALVGVLAAVAAWAAIAQLFARSPFGAALEGELVLESDAPALWERIRALAAGIGTAPPDHIVAGIDSNFYVTEGALEVRGQALAGRKLFVSLPLLRVLDQIEADAVLAHELAHLSGGDTSSSAALGPKLVQFDNYCAALGGFSAHHLLSLYRVIFELALKKDSREREFMADRMAAQFTNGPALMRALIKIAAYSTYRQRVEGELFGRQSAHDGELGIAAFVAQGLQPFAQSRDFASAMETASVPHPFDSHPSLEERMSNVGSVVPAHAYGAVLTGDVAAGWISRIATADQIEARLWADYEARFSQAHEHDLAYRYLPQGDTERAIVERYFPPQVFALKKGRSFTVACDGLILPGEMKTLPWAEISNVQYEDAFLSDILTLTTTEKGVFGNKSKKVKLPGIRSQRAPVKMALGQYWHRYKVASNQA